jgi:hypothetical protein
VNLWVVGDAMIKIKVIELFSARWLVIVWHQILIPNYSHEHIGVGE